MMSAAMNSSYNPTNLCATAKPCPSSRDQGIRSTRGYPAAVQTPNAAPGGHSPAGAGGQPHGPFRPPGPHRPHGPPGYAVRIAGDGELDEGGRVVRLAFEADGLEVGDYAEMLAAARERAETADVAVAVDPGGAVLGCVTFALAGTPWADVARSGEGEFRMLGVHPQARGRGVGLSLVDWCIARARALGCEQLVLSSMPAMLAAQRIYAHRGFTRAPSRDWSPVPGLVLWTFELPLREA